MDEKIRKGAGALVAIGVIGLLGAFGARLWLFGAAPAMPELLQDLGNSQSDANQAAYVERLRQRFPQGSTEAELLGELRRQGFQIRAPQKEASYDRAAGLNDVCRRGGNVRWTADAATRLSAVSGGYYIHCPQN